MTKPMYFWNGSSWELVGPPVVNAFVKYQASAPSSPSTGDLWVDSDDDVDTYQRQLTRFYYVATASQTSVSGADANGLTLAYTPGSEMVYINGALQVRGQDYTATNGTSITGLSALSVNDTVEVFAYSAFNVANAYTKTETDAVAVASTGLRMVVPTSVAVGSGTGSVDSNGAVTFSGASSISLNDAFSTTYQNYKILLNLDSNSAGAFISMRLRVSGADNSTTSYAHTTYRNRMGSASLAAYTQTADGNTFFRILTEAQTETTTGSYDVFNPFISEYTQVSGIGTNNLDTFGFAGSFNATTSFTGFTLLPNTGTITGTVRVYGYKN